MLYSVHCASLATERIVEQLFKKLDLFHHFRVDRGKERRRLGAADGLGRRHIRRRIPTFPCRERAGCAPFLAEKRVGTCRLTRRATWSTALRDRGSYSAAAEKELPATTWGGTWNWLFCSCRRRRAATTSSRCSKKVLKWLRSTQYPEGCTEHKIRYHLLILTNIQIPF